MLWGVWNLLALGGLGGESGVGEGLEAKLFLQLGCLGGRPGLIRMPSSS